MPINPDVFLGRLLVILLGIPIHEWAHCWAASMLGDPTPEMEGRLSLNPLMHLDPMGTLMILLTGFGWGRAARVNPYQMRKASSPRVGMALSALAGPLSNIVQAFFLAIPFRLGWLPLYDTGDPLSRLANVVWWAIAVNIGLAVFNMIPIPPLDGSRVLAGLAPASVADFIEQLEPMAPFILMIFIFVLPRMGLDIIGILVWPVQRFLFQILLP